ncbi:MAG: enoyl-CoA hydratase/isomerase family protein [Candidatus Dormiibacterota bacterium]
MSVGHVTTRVEGEVTLLTLDRPPANAMDLDTLHELIAALAEVAATPPRALVISGRPRFFSAGVDLKFVPTLDAAGQQAMVQGVNDLVLAAYGLPFPVVTAITGHAIAGGFLFALCGDIRIGALDGKYGITEVTVGVPYPAAAIDIVRAELTPAAARYLALSARLVGAEWCADNGVWDEVLSGDDVVPRALEVARELAAAPASVYARTKRELRAETVERLRAAAAADPLLQGWVDAEGRAAVEGALRRD